MDRAPTPALLDRFRELYVRVKEHKGGSRTTRADDQQRHLMGIVNSPLGGGFAACIQAQKVYADARTQIRDHRNLLVFHLAFLRFLIRLIAYVWPEGGQSGRALAGIAAARGLADDRRLSPVMLCAVTDVQVNLWANRIVRHEDAVDPSTLTLDQRRGS